MKLFLVREEARDASFGWVIGHNDIYDTKPTVLFGALCTSQRELLNDGAEILPPHAGWHMFPSYAASSGKIQPKPSSLKIHLRI
jgi:hypothetical protein